MKIRWLLNFAVFTLTLMPLSSHAQDASILELQRMLQERDKVILELLERVEALERRVGVEHFVRPDKTSAEVQIQSADSSTGKVSAAEQADLPGVVVVKEEEAERALERSLTREGALLLSTGVFEIEPSFIYARTEDSAPYLVTSNGQISAAETRLDVDRFTADLTFRLGLPWDSQLEVGLPYRWRKLEFTNVVDFAPTDTSSVSGSGLGDVRVGLAKTLLREGLWRPDLIGRVTWDSDSGELQDDGVLLGGGYNELRGSLTAIKRQDPIAFVGVLSYEHSFEKNQFQPAPVVTAKFGSLIALSPETSLRFLLSGGYQDESELSGNKIVGSDRTLASVELGGTTLLARGTLLNFSIEIGLTDDADDFALSLSLPIRFDKRLY